MHWRVIAAAAIELALLVLAAFGGPHGTLGAVPWMLQLPGILVMLVVPGPRWFVARVVVMAIVQTGTPVPRSGRPLRRLRDARRSTPT